MKVSQANDMSRRIDDTVRELNSLVTEAAHAGLRIEANIIESADMSGVITPLLVVTTYIRPDLLEQE